MAICLTPSAGGTTLHQRRTVQFDRRLFWASGRQEIDRSGAEERVSIVAQDAWTMPRHLGRVGLRGNGALSFFLSLSLSLLAFRYRETCGKPYAVHAGGSSMDNAPGHTIYPYAAGTMPRGTARARPSSRSPHACTPIYHICAGPRSHLCTAARRTDGSLNESSLVYLCFTARHHCWRRCRSGGARSDRCRVCC